METIWFTVLAVVASVLSAGGITSQIISYVRERQNGITKRVELGIRREEVRLGGEKQLIAHIDTLLARIAKLEALQAANVERILHLELGGVQARDAYDVLQIQHRELQAAHEALQADHEMLKKHVEELERLNRVYRQKLEDQRAGGSVR